MAEENDTKVEGKNDVSGTNDKPNTAGDVKNDTSNNQEKMLSQSEVDKIVARARSEGKESGKKDALKAYEGKHVFTEDELQRLLTDKRSEWEAETAKTNALNAKRAEYKARGLTDAQIDLLVEKVDTVENFDTLAETYFGALLKKNAPVINPGNNTNDTNTELDDVDLLLQRMKQRGKR